MNDFYLVIALVLGFLVAWLICQKGIKERDNKIAELEKDINVKQNVIDSNNETINRIRRENERLKKKKGD